MSEIVSPGEGTSDDGTFGLRTALGDDATAELLRRQRATAIRYGETAAADRATTWLVAHGYERAKEDSF